MSLACQNNSSFAAGAFAGANRCGGSFAAAFVFQSGGNQPVQEGCESQEPVQNDSGKAGKAGKHGKNGKHGKHGKHHKSDDANTNQDGYSSSFHNCNGNSLCQGMGGVGGPMGELVGLLMGLLALGGGGGMANGGCGSNSGLGGFLAGFAGGGF